VFHRNGFCTVNDVSKSAQESLVNPLMTCGCVVREALAHSS
jgi:hypothetical protein